jgi:hypothetical protein
MNLDAELRELFDRTDETPWPGEPTAYDRFLRRRARRGRAVAAAAGLAMVAVLAGAVLVPRLLPADTAPVAPTVDRVRVDSQGFELKLPAGWTVQRELMGTRPVARGEALPGTSVGTPRPAVVGLVLVPRSGNPQGTTITITTDANQQLDYSMVQGGSRRADGREYRFHPGSRPGEVGRYAVLWPDFCEPRMGCGNSAWPRILWVAGSASSGGDQVRRVMKQVVGALRPITNARRPPPPPNVPAKTRVLLGTGGSGRAAWQARIEPLRGARGFSMRFPWLQEHGRPGQGMHWESLEPQDVQQQGTWTLMDCLWWSPGSGLLLSGLAMKETATVRFELEGQSPVAVATFGRDKGLPWVAYASPVLPAGSRLERVLAFDAAGKLIGGEERLYGDEALCRPR